MNARDQARIPDFAGQPAVITDAPLALQLLVDEGVRSADEWFDDQHRRQLWRHLAYARALIEPGDNRLAFESGFLNRLQQRVQHLGSVDVSAQAALPRKISPG
ncbi:LasR-specific antiactivator QslA [Phytopseudomonas dryadis]|uniref:LasR-specific antiactivator QslA domain-containing protein n=1 Tax=Phytopseudomonas dryadis TaxID=2487520 RepID=A0A4Q9R5Z7_9GAMM|nr:MULTISPECIES: LasR-specific antiactivator QslA [Pseudomonas]TBU95440.1 hypothetical protein DNK44_07735 [Pseudomonas dryadis]TBV03819.1 hypothetical protein DNK34_15945 [Pseudomonas dryadis]TBV16036.1 hypothetical protein DNK41_16510 [Pseudomonas sp. FRB 230]